MANNFVMYIDIICIAFNYFAGRNIAVSYHNGNNGAACGYYSTILATDLLLLFLLGGCGAFIVSYIDRVINISTWLIIDVKIFENNRN